MATDVLDVLRTKRDGGALSDEQIRFFLDGYTAGTIADEQAAALLDDGRVVVGCNVENASYGLTVCAEVGMVSAVHAAGGGKVVAVAVTGADGTPLACCGRCRQILHEHGGPTLLVNERPMAEWLPHAWGPDDLTPPA